MQMSSHAVNYSYCLPGYEFQRPAHLYAIFYTRGMRDGVRRQSVPLLLSRCTFERSSRTPSEIEPDDRKVRDRD